MFRPVSKYIGLLKLGMIQREGNLVKGTEARILIRRNVDVIGMKIVRNVFQYELSFLLVSTGIFCLDL